MRRLLAFTALIVLLTAALSGAAIVYGRVHRGAGVISFDSFMSGHRNIYLYDLDTQTRVSITPGFHYAQTIAWSPNGWRMVFAGGDGWLDLYQIDVIDGRIAKLESSHQFEIPEGISQAWSPDGRWLWVNYLGLVAWYDPLLIDMSMDPPAVETVDLFTRNYPMAWSPDSSYLSIRIALSGNAYWVDYDVRQHSVIIPSPALPSGSISDGYPSWSPDGTQIAFLRRLENGLALLYLMNTDGTDVHVVMSDAVSPSPPFWTPDGQNLILDVYEPTTGRVQLVLVDKETGMVTTLRQDGWVYYYPVSLIDASHLLTMSIVDTRVPQKQAFLININTGEITLIPTGALDVSNLQWVPW